MFYHLFKGFQKTTFDFKGAGYLVSFRNIKLTEELFPISAACFEHCAPRHGVPIGGGKCHKYDVSQRICCEIVMESAEKILLYEHDDESY